MSAYENVIGGKLKLKGKALDVKAGGVKKKKKHKRKDQDQISQLAKQQQQEDPSAVVPGESGVEPNEEVEEDGDKNDEGGGGGKAGPDDDLLTPVERRYIEQRERIDVKRLAKTANKSHRDRIQDFNQYLANMSEHYDIPKVGPG